MDLQLDWLPPVSLLDGRDDNSTYVLKDWSQILPYPGIYIFGRRHGRRFSPIYIGKAMELDRRIKQQLNNNRLMNALLNAQRGQRELLVGELVPKSGQQAHKVIEILERGLIKLALAEGHELVNRSGTRIDSHRVEMIGNRLARSWIRERTFYLEK